MNKRLLRNIKDVHLRLKMGALIAKVSKVRFSGL